MPAGRGDVPERHTIGQVLSGVFASLFEQQLSDIGGITECVVLELLGVFDLIGRELVGKISPAVSSVVEWGSGDACSLSLSRESAHRPVWHVSGTPLVLRPKNYL